MENSGLFYLYLGVVLLVSLSFHEVAHGMVALWFGDQTAKNEGRLTLNPLKHLDPAGTVFFLLFKFGWGKPVPVNPMNFKNPQRDMAITAMAGPATNLVLAILFAQALKLLLVAPVALPAKEIGAFLALGLQVNIMLMIFNLLPFPPLDGGHVLMYFIRDKQVALAVSQRGPAIFLVLMLINYLTGGVVLGTIFFPIVEAIMGVLL